MCIQLFPNPPPRTRYADIAELLRSLGEPAYRLSQLVQSVHRSGITEYAQLSALPRRVRTQLIEAFGPTFADLRPIARQSGDQVEKTLFENDNGARIETVFARYRTGWTSLCLSTQVGCGLGCTFCATGAVGLVRNLTADEICDQVLYHQRRGTVDSVAFMGMGEALANPHTFPALSVLTHPDYFALSPRRITVSTVGFAPGLQRLVDSHPQVNVTLSVHSPFADERASLIPLERRFSLESCLAILDGHVAATRRKTYLAYLLIDGVNDSPAHAAALAELVNERALPRLFHVSVIPYNDAVGVTPAYRRPSAARVASFLRVLRQANVRATQRQQFGGALDAACGQLHARYLSSAPVPERRRLPVTAG
jgi:23S rRNA (adenine-C8)-methyltransferase